jgi:amino acid adenylation domain-containing protein
MASLHQQKSLISGFLRSLHQHPNRIALELGERQLTYEQLWERAGRVARALNSCLDPAERLVALFANRSVTAYAGVLGILATGRGYVPLNPAFPVERTLRMLNASGCKGVILGSEADQAAGDLASGARERLVWLLPDDEYRLGRDSLTPHQVITACEMQQAADPDAPSVDRDSTAYLLFTSGSTGTPKGVAVSQRSVTSYLSYVDQRYAVQPDDRCSQNFDLTFDLSVHDLFVCWDAGATLCPFPERYLVPASLVGEKKLTVWFSVPSVAMFASKLGLLEPGALSSLRLSLFCGEALSARLAAQWQEAAPRSILENLYGPTEATIAISHYRWDPVTSPEKCVGGIVPIGWIFEGQKYCIVDEKLSPVSPGDAGELCLAGSQVAAGYLNDPERTKHQFVRIAGMGAGPWYRTGDLVKEDERGCLHYLRRVDHQVKISGYRVELQEIELVLREAAGTELAVAVPWPVVDGTAAGIVAVLCGSDPSRDHGILKICEERLPRYMVPNRIHHWKSLPVNANGKLDRKRISELIRAAE